MKNCDQKKLKQNNAGKEKKRPEKPMIFFLMLLILTGSAAGYHFYTKGYLDQILADCGLYSCSDKKDGAVTETMQDDQERSEAADMTDYRILTLDPEQEYIYMTSEDRDVMFRTSDGFKITIVGDVKWDETGEYPVILKYATHKGSVMADSKIIFVGTEQEINEHIAYVSSLKEEGGSSDTSNKTSSESDPVLAISVPENKKKGHWETRTETIPAWDEEVLVAAGYYEQVLVREGWDEEETYCSVYGQDQTEVYICNTCGAVFYDSSVNTHLSEAGHAGWHNDYILVGDPYCQEYGTDIIHHDAVYEKVWHDPVYRTVHHPEETRAYQVWVEG